MTIDSDLKAAVVQKIREYIAKNHISREEFARRAKIGKSTVDKIVTGIFTEKTLMQIEAQLGLDLLGHMHDLQCAREEFGGYAAADVRDYLGRYVLVRPSLNEDESLNAFGMELLWDETIPALVVREISTMHELLPPQIATVYLPKASMYLFLLSNDKGWLKQAILSRIGVDGIMKGIMLTMGHAFGSVYIPVAMPVILKKTQDVEKGSIGKINVGSKLYDVYANLLKSVESDQYAKWFTI